MSGDVAAGSDESCRARTLEQVGVAGEDANQIGRAGPGDQRAVPETAPNTKEKEKQQRKQSGHRIASTNQHPVKMDTS